MTNRELTELNAKLSVFYDPADAILWMQSPHPQLEGRRPMDAGYQEVMAIIDRLESGAYL